MPAYRQRKIIEELQSMLNAWLSHGIRRDFVIYLRVYELRNRLFSVKDKTSCREQETWCKKIRNLAKRLLCDGFIFFMLKVW
jgi:hypothetical protein